MMQMLWYTCSYSHVHTHTHASTHADCNGTNKFLQIILPENEFDQLRSSSGQSSLEHCSTLQEYHLTAVPDHWYSEDTMSKMLVITKL